MTQDAAGTITGPFPTLTIRPDANLKILCAEEGKPALQKAPGESCSFSKWDYKAAVRGGDQWTASFKVVMEPSPVLPADGLAPGQWKLEVLSNGLKGAPRTVLTTYAPQTTPGEGAIADASDLDGATAGAYRGFVTLQLPLGGVATVPVEARVDGINQTMWMRDRTFTLSASSVLNVARRPIDQAIYGEPVPWLARSDDDLEARASVFFNIINATFRGVPGKPDEGRLSGTMRGLMFHGIRPTSAGSPFVDLNASFDLKKDASVVFCDGNQRCSVGLTCGPSGFCQKNVITTTGLFVDTQIDPKWLSRWTNDVPFGAKGINSRGFEELRDIEEVWCLADRQQFVTPEDANDLARDPLLSSGDVACFDQFGFQGAGPIPFQNHGEMSRRAPWKVSGTVKNAEGMLRRCLQELKRRPTALLQTRAARSSNEASFFASDAEGISDFPAECVNLGVVGQVFDLAAAYDARGGAATRRALLRLVTQLLELHTFIGRQGVQQWELDQVQSFVAGEGRSSSAPALHELSKRMESGLALTLANLGHLTRRMTELEGDRASFALPEDAIRLAATMHGDYDYRTPWGQQLWKCGSSENVCFSDSLICLSRFELARRCRSVPGSPPIDRAAFCAANPTSLCCPREYKYCAPSPELPARDDQADGIAPAAFNALAAQFQLVNALLKDAQSKNYVDPLRGVSPSDIEALSLYGSAFRMGIILAGRATFLAPPTEAETTKQQGILNRYLQASRSMIVARQDALESALGMSSGTNPLGIAETDLPLLFGDPVGTNSRYFASSDYLLEKWADPAVKSAQSILSGAREAWLAQKTGSLSLEAALADQDRRLDAIRLPAGRTILDNCGGLEIDGSALLSGDVIETVQKYETNTQRERLLVTPSASDPPASMSTGQRFTLDSCYIKGSTQSIRSNSQGPAREAADKACDPTGADRAEFFKQRFGAAAARGELCRLDYMRVHYPEAVPQAKSAPWACFMSPGPARFCDDELGNEPRGCSPIDVQCKNTCVDKCDACGKGTQSLECRSSCGAYTLGFCNGLRSDLAKAMNNARYRPPGCGVQNSQVCTVYPFKALSAKLATLASTLLNTPVNFVDERGVEYPDLSAKRAHFVECLSSAVPDNVLPSQRPQGLSTLWQLASVVDGAVVIPEGSWPTTNDPRPTCKVPVESFFDTGTQAVSRLNYAEQWLEADTMCASRGFGGELPFYQIPTSCYAGNIGESMALVTGAVSELKDVRGDLAGAVARFDEQALKCEENIKLDALLVTKLRELKKKKRDWTRVAAIVAVAAGAAALCVVTGGAATPGVFALATVSSATTGGLIVGGIGLAAAGAGPLIQGQIDAAETDFRTFSQQVAGRKDAIECQQTLNDAHRGIQDVAARLKTVVVNLETGFLRSSNLIAQNRQTFRDGIAALDVEKGRPVGVLAHHYWFDEKVDRFKKEFAWAKRLSFLAMRAVEFEFQQSLSLRQQIVGARHPDGLEDALRVLKQEQGTRAVNRRRPEESSIVLSLRDDVLKIEDKTKAPHGERQWTPSQRFRGRLKSDIFTLRDREGQWLGQAVTFNLREQRELETRCGERLWRVTATVQGDGLSPLEPGTPIMLLKRNTFASQYCNGRSNGDSKYQIASIQPSGNLFRGNAGRAEEVAGFSTAFMYPWFNVRRQDFYATEYTKGASEELAGRGLYGDYILLFPKQVIEAGFPLDRVEDVLLRFDYLSVDNLSELQADDKAAGEKIVNQTSESVSVRQ